MVSGEHGDHRIAAKWDPAVVAFSCADYAEIQLVVVKFLDQLSAGAVYDTKLYARIFAVDL